MSSVLAAFANGAIVSAVLTAAVWLGLRLAPRQRLNAATRYAFWWATWAATLALPVLYVRTPAHDRVAHIAGAVPTKASPRPAREDWPFCQPATGCGGDTLVGQAVSPVKPAERWLWAGRGPAPLSFTARSEEHTSELHAPCNLVCRLLLEK